MKIEVNLNRRTHHFFLYLLLHYAQTFNGEYFPFWLLPSSIPLRCATDKECEVVEYARVRAFDDEWEP